jgi:CPA2 family monovalent cation:H+ antiporter-2
LQTFAALYGTWMEQLRSRQREMTAGGRIWSLIFYLLLDSVLLGAVLIAAAVWGRAVASRIGAALDTSDIAGGLGVVLATGAIALPFCIGIARCIVALAQALGNAALPSTDAKADMADAPRRALIATIELAILLMIGIPLTAVTQPFLPPFPGAAVLAVVITLVAFTLWRSVTNLQAHARAGAQAIVEVLARQTKGAGESGNEDLERLHRVLPGLGAPLPVRVESKSAAVGQTLAQLNLRGRSGATVLAIVRGHTGVAVPTGREALQAGDLLALAGTEEAVEAARLILQEPIWRPTSVPPLKQSREGI